MATDNGESRLQKTIVATMIVMLVGLLIVPSITRWNNRQVADRLLVKIKNADDRSVKVPLRQLDSLGDAAIEPLMAAAASPRTAVSLIARQIIEERLAQLQQSSLQSVDEPLPEPAVQTAAALSSALARQVRNFGPAGKQWAEGIALAMIELTDKLPAQQTYLLLENCSDVLTEVPARGTKMRSLAQAPVASQENLLEQLDSAVPKLEPMTRVSEKSLEQLARIQPRSAIQFQPSEATPQETSTVVVQPNPTDLDWQGQSLNPSQAKPLQPLAEPEPEPTPLAARPLAEAPTSTSKGGIVDIPNPQTMAAQAEMLRSYSTGELFARLRSAKFYEAGVIRSVLAERGMVEAEIDLRIRLNSPQSSDRLRFVDEVSSLPSNSARRTFLWLLEDKSGDVRLRALTALATTRHPEVLRVARDLAVHDEDPRVANLASQLIR